MNFFDYIGVEPQEFADKYLDEGYVQEQKHAEFPLNIYSYSRRCVKEQLWDGVTSKCRGIIVNRETGEIVARPFEKFHNFGTKDRSETSPEFLSTLPSPTIWEKMDGFLCTLYTWQGIDYIASKGSFHSTHAKWATAWYRAKFGESAKFPEGWTPVFEGLCPSLRIVVDYKAREEMVLLALVNKERGGEYPPELLSWIAAHRGLRTPCAFGGTWQEKVSATINNSVLNEEGFVLTWYTNPDAPPLRVKLKYVEYLRLHRMVTGVSPKRIWEVVASEQSSELKEWLDQSNPWFSDFVGKWTRALNFEYSRINTAATEAYNDAREACRVKVGQTPYENMGAERKAYAEEFLRGDNKEFSPVLFGMLDGRDIKPLIWKMVKRLIHGSHPMVDGHVV